jgi:hypothetical protein
MGFPLKCIKARVLEGGEDMSNSVCLLELMGVLEQYTYKIVFILLAF